MASPPPSFDGSNNVGATAARTTATSSAIMVARPMRECRVGIDATEGEGGHRYHVNAIPTATSSAATTTMAATPYDDQISVDGADSDSYYSTASNNNNNSNHNSSTNSDSWWQEPIVVGYAFGPKKMSTMGVVMAEASRITVIHEEPDEDDDGDRNDNDDGDGEDDDDEDDDDNDVGAFHEEDQNDTYRTNDDWEDRSSPAEIAKSAVSSVAIKTSRTMTANVEGCSARPRSRKRVPSTLTSDALKGLEDDGTTDPESTIISLANTNETDIKQIVRYFRSSCSSAAASIASTSEITVSTPTTTATTSSTSAPAGASAMCAIGGTRRHHRRRRRSRHPVRVSFVPLDPDQPLECQHGGYFDLILHKLTEDILSWSLMLSANNGDDSSYTLEDTTPSNHKSIDPSWKRVRSLLDYHRRHSNCCLVDDPAHVQIVMSRSDIANVLQQWLQGVRTTSGIAVKSPKFVVIPETRGSTSEEACHKLKRQLQEQGITTPLIVKPLIAAGTKQSHSMLIALRESALARLPPKSIVQEYVNHNATLYKVYVLGDFISVYERHSLPNLPNDVSDRTTIDLMEFDSQRPYPKLNDFGLRDQAQEDTTLESNAQRGLRPSAPCSPVNVTIEEVKPIVDVLKQAFGLELFGFDILLGNNGREWLVVDVNYFPSYKEVPDFPSLLAQYLTQRVLEQRRRSRMPNTSYDESGRHDEISIDDHHGSDTIFER